MRKLPMFSVALLLLLGGSALASHRKPVEHWRHYGGAVPAAPYLAPEAYAMRVQQGFWPGRPLCDDGGYRIRPCDIAPGGGGFAR